MRNLEIEKKLGDLSSVIGCTSYDISMICDYKDCDEDFFNELLGIKEYLNTLTSDEKLEIYKELIDFDSFDEKEKEEELELIENTQEAIDDYLQWVRDENK